MSSGTNKRATAVLIVCQLGPFPHYFQLFLRSCAHAGVDFVFITDQNPPSRLPSNARWVRVDKSEIENRAAKASGISVTIATGYKLCDLKPAYGVMFQDLIEDYQFWGHVDTDVILGNLSDVIDARGSDNPDIISTDGNFWVSGALTIYRNCEIINTLFKRFNAGQKAFACKEHIGFDETCGRYDKFQKIHDLIDAGENISMTDIIVDLAELGMVKFYQDFQILEPKTGFSVDYNFEVQWSDHRLIDVIRNREIALFHLIFAKNDPFFYFPKWSMHPIFAIIDPKGIREIGDSDIRSFRFEIIRLLRGFTPFARSLGRRARSAIARRLV